MTNQNLPPIKNGYIFFNYGLTNSQQLNIRGEKLKVQPTNMWHHAQQKGT